MTAAPLVLAAAHGERGHFPVIPQYPYVKFDLIILADFLDIST